MQTWKEELYQNYVSTGQSTATLKSTQGIDTPYFRWLIGRTLRNEVNPKILDLACGDGVLLRALQDEGFLDCFGIDISGEQIDAARKSGLKNVETDDAINYLGTYKGGKFDVVFMLDILEHLERDQMIRLMNSIHPNLSPQGKIIIQVPNATGVFGMHIRYGDLTHEFAFTKQSISQLLSFTGFQIDSIQEIKPMVHGFTSLVRRLIWSMGTLSYRILLAAETGHFDHILSQNMVIVARKAALRTPETS